MFCNQAVLWCCNKHKSDALSSTEFAFIALTERLQNLFFFNNMACEITIINDLVLVWDNQLFIVCIRKVNVRADKFIEFISI